MNCADCSTLHPPIVLISSRPALASSSRITITRVPCTTGFSRLGCVMITPVRCCGTPSDDMLLMTIHSRAAHVCVLAILAAFAVVVGGHDAFAASDLGVRVTGSLLFLAGVVIALAAVAIVRKSKRGYPLGIVACLVGALLCMLMIATLIIDHNA